MENGVWVVVVKSSLDKLGDDQNLYRSCFKLNSFSWFLWNEMWTFLTSNFFFTYPLTQDPILNRSFVNQSFILFALISSFFLFSPVQDPEQLTEEEEMKEEKPKMSHINSAITGFEKAFEQFATGGIQSHVTNPVSRPDILKDNKPDVGGFFFLIILVVSICSLYIYILK